MKETDRGQDRKGDADRQDKRDGQTGRARGTASQDKRDREGTRQDNGKIEVIQGKRKKMREKR